MAPTASPEPRLKQPHPFLQRKVLYLHSVPNQATPQFIRHVFAPCCRDEPLSLRKVGDGDELVSWRVQFDSLWTTEMALATLNKQVVRDGTTRPWKVELSPYRRRERRWNMSDCPLPQFLKPAEPALWHPLQDESAQSLFAMFRVAGPLISVQKNVSIGPGPQQRTIVVHHWNEDHARAAQSLLTESYKNKGRLQPFDPYVLHCGGLDRMVTEKMLSQLFAGFGPPSVKLVFTKRPNPNFAFLTFQKQTDATNALACLQGTMLLSKNIILRLCEKKTLEAPPRADTRSTSTSPQESDDDESEEEDSANDEVPEARAEEPKAPQGPNTSNAPESPKVPESPNVSESPKVPETPKASEGPKTKDHETNGNATPADGPFDRYVAARRKRMDAEEADLRLLSSRNQVLGEESGVASELEDMRWTYLEMFQEHEDAQRELLGAEKARAEAEKREATLREKQHALQVSLKAKIAEMQRASKKAADVQRRRKALDAAVEDALQRRDALRSDEGRFYQEWFSQSTDTASIVDDVLAFISNQQAEQNAETQKRETEAKKAAEESRRLEQEKLQQEREARLEEASDAEILRCTKRDAANWPHRRTWSANSALERYRMLSAEFDATKFCDDRPLTFWSVPWPTLHYPADLKWENVESVIDWDTVEAFFARMKILLKHSEYRTLVDETHRRFHPDKWKARGVLASTVPASNCAVLEAAGNRVSQAVTPLRMASRNI